jgi:solute:Na+ symporter, SSS family
MFDHLNLVAASVFVFFFALVTILGFLASRWKAADLGHIAEWGLGGRQFGPWITWFLLGGDLYTAYTVIAIPAVVYSVGAYGFFAVPYTILIYPFLYLTMPRLWAVSRKHGYMTAGDFVLGRYGDRWLELAVALTGILATMPYIALQLVGLEKVISALGFAGQGAMAHAPITIAFVILALYTYKSGLRAPAMIAFVKDTMIYVFIIAAIFVIPYELGGFGAIFAAA